MKNYSMELGREEGQKAIVTNMMDNEITIPEISKIVNMFEEENNNLLN